MIEDLQEVLNYAKRVAAKMSKDPEAMSLAGLAAWKAQQTFDTSHNVPEKRWIALIVKQHVWGYWKSVARRREEFPAETWWEDIQSSGDVEPIVLDIPDEDKELLEESLVYKWPLDVIASRRGMSIYNLRKRLAAAKARLHEHIS